MNRLPRQPSLFSLPEDNTSASSLMGCYCESCGKTFFPPQTYGCENCGGLPEKLKLVDLKGSGELMSFATVYKHFSPIIQTPFIMGSIQLEDGPVIEAVIDCEDDSELRVGTKMKAVLVENEKDQNDTIFVDYRFTIDKG